MVSEFNKYNGLIEETDEVSIFDDFDDETKLEIPEGDDIIEI